MKKFLLIIIITISTNLLFAETNIWINDSIYSYEWNSNLNDWEQSRKYEISYDDKGNKILEITYKWLSEWLEYTKYKDEYTYDTNNNVIVDISYYWDSWDNVWTESKKYTSTYDSNNNEELGTYYFTNYDTGVWEAWYKSEFSYDTEGNQILEISYNWDWDYTFDWIIGFKNEFTYDNEGNQISKIYYDWNSSQNIWEQSSKNEYQYDEQNNQISDIEYDWISGNWVESYKKEFSFDVNNNIETRISYTWNTSTNTWDKTYKSDYYWSLLPLAINEINNIEKFEIFPNPATENINVKTNNLAVESNISIFSIDGKLIYSNSFKLPTITVNLSKIEKGIYLLKIENKKSISTKKLIIN